MDFGLYLKESVLGSFNSVKTMASIIIPIMVCMEILKDSNILDKISKKLKFISDFFNMSHMTIFPMLVGFIFGISYGAGVIIESAEEGNLTKNDLYILMIFLIACHAVIEDTLLFGVVGVNLWLLFTLRVGVALVITFISSKIIPKLKLEKIK